MSANRWRRTLAAGGEDAGDGAAAGVARSPGGCGVVAGDADGHGEGDPAGVDPGGLGYLCPQGAWRLAGGEKGV